MILNFPKKISPELAEEVGWHVGDGSMNYYNYSGRRKGFYQLRGHIEDDREHYLRRIKPIFKELYGVDVSLRDMPSTRVFGFQIWSSELVKFKESLGLGLGPKISVKIPDIFLNDKRLKISVLRGIFDTDGCVYLEKKNKKLYPKMEIQTISLPLALQLREIFNSLGLRATLYTNKNLNHPNKKICYAVTIRGVEMLHRFFDVIEPKNQKHLDKYSFFTQSLNNL